MAPVHGPPNLRRAAVDLGWTLENLFDPAHRVKRQREVAQMRRELLRRSEEQADRPDDEDEVAGGQRCRRSRCSPATTAPALRARRRAAPTAPQPERQVRCVGALALGEFVEVVDEPSDEAVGQARQAHRAQLDEGVDRPAGEPFHGHPHVMLGVGRTAAGRVPDQPRQRQRRTRPLPHRPSSNGRGSERPRTMQSPRPPQRHEVRPDPDPRRYGHGAEYEPGCAPGVVHTLGKGGEVAEQLLADVA